jgi:hypothetical protein
MAGTDFFYESVFSLRDAAAELLREVRSPLELPRDAIVCMMHQGYQFAFILASTDDDPAVEYYLEGDEKFSELYAHYSQYLSVLVHEHLTQSIESGS